MSDDFYIAKPSSGPGKGVLVLHAWWGLNVFFKSFCDRLAREGFVALAPDLYHGVTASTIDEAKKLSSNLDPHTASQEIDRAAGRLHSLCGPAGQTIGVLGFSLGGYWALRLAEQPSSRVAAAVVFYSARKGDYTQSRSAFQFHLAETDDFVPASAVKELRDGLIAAGKEVDVYTYPGTTHWFFETDRPAAYNRKAAAMAWDRTAGFLKKHIK